MELKGFVFSFILDNNGSGQKMTFNELSENLNNEKDIWIHLNYDDENLHHWLTDKMGLDDAVAKILTGDDPRPRIEHFDDKTLLILRGINFNPDSDPEDMVSLRIWIEKNRLITVRKRKVKTIEDISKKIENGDGPKNIEELLLKIAAIMAERTGEVLSEIDDEVDESENLILTENIKTLRSKISDIRRKIISLRRYIYPQKTVYSSFLKSYPKWFSENAIDKIKELEELYAKYIDDLDSMRSLALVTSEELNGKISDNMNKTMYLLSLVTAIFLPLGFLTGLLGINIAGIPGADYNSAFLIFCGILLIIAITEITIFKIKKWI